jgi:predicted transcriptional regulator
VTTLDTTLAPGVCPASALGLPPRQGAVLAVLWAAPQPLTAAQVTTRLPAGPGIQHALGRLRAAGLIEATRSGDRARRYQPTIDRDDYLAAQIAAMLDLACDQAAVLRAALYKRPVARHGEG